MFKKLKDKIAEEVRQAPLRLPASVQNQLSQVIHLNLLYLDLDLLPFFTSLGSIEHNS